MARRDFIIALIYTIIIGTVIGIIQGFNLIEPLTNDGQFLHGSILAIAGFLIVRSISGKRHKYQKLYFILSGILMSVGFMLLFEPLIKQVFSNH